MGLAHSEALRSLGIATPAIAGLRPAPAGEKTPPQAALSPKGRAIFASFRAECEDHSRWFGQVERSMSTWMEAGASMAKSGAANFSRRRSRRTSKRQ